MIINLENKKVKLQIDSIGCTLRSLQYCPDSHWINTILSLKAKDYPNQDWYCGATVGRFSNRIDKGIFELNGTTYQIPVATEGNALHGNHGLDRVDWLYVPQESSDQKAVFSYVSKHSENGFPGNVTFKISFSIDDTSVDIDYHATTDQETPISLTHHPYFNLNSQHDETIHNHKFLLFSHGYLELNNMIPTGVVIPDTTFSQYRSLDGEDYDDCFLVSDHNPSQLNKNARIQNESTGIQLDILSDLPSFQFYTAQWLPSMKDNTGQSIGPNTGFCIEPQYYPDSPNHPEFPNCIFSPNRPYKHTIQYTFSTL